VVDLCVRGLQVDEYAVGNLMKIGVLALQGAFREHIMMLQSLGVTASKVRNPIDLEDLDGLIIPGGESTAIAKLMNIHHLYEPLIQAHAQGLAFFGTCAGAILLARKAEGARNDQRLLALLDVCIARNAYGRQVDSFETIVPFASVESSEVRGIFIRAPRFTKLSPKVAILSVNAEGQPLAVQQGRVLALAFHPELTDDNRVHRYFLEHVVGS